MTTTSSRFFDEIAKLMNSAAGAAQGVRREIDTLVKAQVERVLNELNVVQQEEFDAVKEMASRARRRMSDCSDAWRSSSGRPPQRVRRASRNRNPRLSRVRAAAVPGKRVRQRRNHRPAVLEEAQKSWFIPEKSISGLDARLAIGQLLVWWLGH